MLVEPAVPEVKARNNVEIHENARKQPEEHQKQHRRNDRGDRAARTRAFFLFRRLQKLRLCRVLGARLRHGSLHRFCGDGGLHRRLFGARFARIPLLLRIHAAADTLHGAARIRLFGERALRFQRILGQVAVRDAANANLLIGDRGNARRNIDIFVLMQQLAIE